MNEELTICIESIAVLTTAYKLWIIYKLIVYKLFVSTLLVYL